MNESVKNTEITKDVLSEFFYPTVNFRRCTDNVVVDYAEIEINPKGIKRFERNLERCKDKTEFSEEEYNQLNDINSDLYEHVVTYVHFKAGTCEFDKMFIEVVDTYSSCELDTSIISEEEKNSIIEVALESLKHGKETNEIMCW